MRKFTKTLALVLALVMLLTAAGCSAPAAESTTAAIKETTALAQQPANGGTGSDQEPVSIRFSWWGGESRHEATKAAVDAFMKEYPWITVECEYGSFDGGWQDKVATQLAGKTAPDLLQINWNWLYQYSNDGSKFVDLNDYSDIISLGNFPQKDLEAMTVGGKMQGVPISVSSKMFFFNKTSYEKAGLAVPATWDELIAAGSVFKEKLGDEYYPMSDGAYARFWMMLLWLQQKYGKPWVENMECQYTADEVKEGMEFINSLEENHVEPTIAQRQADGVENDLTNPKWMDGRYAGFLEYESGTENNLNSVNEDQEVVPGEFLTMEGAKPFGFTKVSQGFAITETSEHKEEAALLLEFITSNEAGVKAMGTQRGIPCNTKAREYLEAEGMISPVVEQAASIVADTCAFSIDPNFENSTLYADTGVYIEVFENLSAGGDPAELAQYLIDSVNDVNAANPY